MSDVNLPTTEELDELSRQSALGMRFDWRERGTLISAARQAIQLQAEVTRMREERAKLGELFMATEDKALGYETRSAHRDELARLLDAIAAESGRETEG